MNNAKRLSVTIYTALANLVVQVIVAECGGTLPEWTLYATIIGTGALLIWAIPRHPDTP